jgi:cobalt-zinc-cadmium efflux system outer membrane protein
LSFSVPLPLWNRNQGRIHAQQATANQAREQGLAQRLTIRTEVASSMARAERMRAATELYQKSILPLANQNIELLQTGYAQGLTSLAQIIQTQNQQLTLRNSYFDALTRYAEALVDLETAAGSNPHLKRDVLQKRTRTAVRSGSTK